MKSTIITAGLFLVFMGTMVSAGDDTRVPDKAKSDPMSQVLNVAQGPKTIPPGLEKRVFIHYRKAHGKPSGTPGGGKGKKPKEPTCYDFLGRGIVWKNTVDIPYVVQSDLNMYARAISSGASAWGLSGVPTLYEADAIGEPAVGEEEPDLVNELVLAPLSSNIIAQASVWGFFTGPPGKREIVMFDIVFNSNYQWDIVHGSCSQIMDIQNIATHEFGHGLGMGDVYQDACADVTMFGYSDYCEINKRTLEDPDKKGIQELYK